MELGWSAIGGVGDELVVMRWQLGRKDKSGLGKRIDKAYPRDFMHGGRLRSLLKREDGTLYNPAISSGKQLMLHVGMLQNCYAICVFYVHPGMTKKQKAAGPSSKSGKGGRKKR
ncbi:hypothetical protein Q3G72_007742 [Acer saccharum]|nr:hypothetical protein Q3G72_007742 [Acer saccharum]